MIMISGILGGTSPNKYSEMAHDQFLALFSRSSKREQDRIVKQAKLIFTKDKIHLLIKNIGGLHIRHTNIGPWQFLFQSNVEPPYI